MERNMQRRGGRERKERINENNEIFLFPQVKKQNFLGVRISNKEKWLMVNKDNKS